MNYQQEIDGFRQQLRQIGNPERAAGEKAYLKSDQQFYGVKVPVLRKITKSWLKQHQDSHIATITELARQLWDSDWHEERSLAAMLLEYRSPDLTREQLPIIEHMLNTATGWAHLDALAVWVVGALIDNERPANPRRSAPLGTIPKLLGTSGGDTGPDSPVPTG
jgi:3-methyladenine DNA glycosylase AlkD